MKKYLCYFQIHVENRLFNWHVLVEAESKNDALNKLKERRGEHYHQQPKGCLGEFTEELAWKFMKLSSDSPDHV
jgi:hypothetical protein